MPHRYGGVAKLKIPLAKHQQNVVRIGVVADDRSEVARFGAGPKGERVPFAVVGFGLGEGGRKAGAKEGEMEEFSEEVENEAAKAGVGSREKEGGECCGKEGVFGDFAALSMVGV